MIGPAVVIADAGQMYEAMKCDQAVRLFKQVAKQSRIKFVNVRKSKKRAVYVTESKHSVKPGWINFEISSIIQAFIVAVCATTCSLGDRMLKTQGIATGGLMSKTAASTILCSAEDR